MISSILKSPLYPIANPKSIAFFGASNNHAAMASGILEHIISDG
jgi:acyl-CoA synthetase (NDP forming)